MRRSSVTLSCLLLSCAGSTPPVHEDRPVAPAAAAETAASRETHGEPRKQGADHAPLVEVLKEEGIFSYDAEGRRTYTLHYHYRILTREAVDSGWAEISMAYEAWRQAQPELHAKVTTADGVVHTLDAATASERPAGGGEDDKVYTDWREVKAPLPAIAPGAVVEEEMIVRDTEPPAGGLTGDDFYFGSRSEGRQLVRLVIELPANKQLTYRALGFQITPREEKDAGRRRLIFEAHDVAKLPPQEWFLPSDVYSLPRVYFASATSWSEVAKTYDAIVDRQIASAGLEATAKSIAGNARTPKELASRLLTSVQKNVRYTGVELGDASIVPRSPKEVLERKYGDCKDQAAYLVALFRALGKEAHVALLRVGRREDVMEDVPSLTTFNHAIVYVPGTPALWIDPTDNLSRAGALPAGDQGRLSLVVSPSSRQLIRTPEATMTENKSVETREIVLAESGKGRVLETTDTWGSHERSARSDMAGGDRQKTIESITKYAKNEYGAKELGKVDFADPYDLANEKSDHYRIQLEARNVDVAYTGDDEAQAVLGPWHILGGLPRMLKSKLEEEKSEQQEAPSGDQPPRLADRKRDFVLAEVFSSDVRYLITPPAGFTVRTLPESKTLELAPAALRSTYTKKNDGTIEASFHFEIARKRLTADEARAIAKGVYEAWSKNEEIKILFDREAARLTADGKHKEALAETRKLAAAHPESGLHRAHLAEAMCKAGFCEAARREAKLAAEKDPKSELVMRILGSVLAHDALGRYLGPGYDREGAIAALRKARALDDKISASRINLAVLLEHNADGKRYGPGADLDGAVKEYRALRADLKRKDRDVGLLYALFWSKRFEELEKLAPEVASSTARDSLWLAALAAHGAESAVDAKITELAMPAEARVKTLAAASSLLMNARMYPQAARLAQASLHGSATAAEEQARIAFLRNVKNREDNPPSLKTPQGVIMSFIFGLFAEKGEPGAWTKLFSRELLGVEKVTDRELQGMRRGFRLATRKSELEIDTLLDIVAAVATPSVEGDDAGGYRVKLTMAMGQSLSAFLIKEDGALKVRAMSTMPFELGEEARKRAAAGDLAGAKRWLGWGAETLGAMRSSMSEEHPFLRAWSSGQPSEKSELELYASLLASGGAHPAAAAKVLEAGRDRASPELQRGIDAALLAADIKLERWNELSKVADRMLAADAQRKSALAAKMLALEKLNRLDEARAFIEKQVAASPNDLALVMMLINIHTRRSDFDAAEAVGKKAIAAGIADASVYNLLAWNTLFVERRGAKQSADAGLEYAQKAASLSNMSNASILNTLGTINADLGKTTEAMQLVMKDMDLLGMEEPLDADWYVIGRVAEEYGLPDAAKTAYEKVKAAEKNNPTDPRILVERRLKAMKPRS